MTRSPDDGRYEVPIERLAAGRDQARRAAIVAVTIVGVVGGAFVLGRLTSATRPGPAAATSTAGVAVIGGSPGASPARGGSSAPTTRPGTARIERLLDVPDRALPGSPQAVLLQRAGNDLQVVAWRPGSGLTMLRTIPDAIAPTGDGTESAVLPLLSPDGTRLIVLTPDSRLTGDGDPGRLLDAAGNVLWVGDRLAAASGAVWSDDSRMVVVAGHPRQWHLVTIDGRGTATDRVVDLPGAVFLPVPTPIGSITVGGAEPRTVPLGFSADGRWVYGGVVSAQLGILLGQFRVATAGDRIEAVADLHVGRADGLVPRPGTLGGRLVDGATGRVANWRINSDTSGGPPTVEVRNPDAGFAFTVDVDTPLGSAWGADGGLYVLSSDAPIFLDRTALVRIGADGKASRPILETGPLMSAGFVGIRGGYAALVAVVSRPAAGAQLILVNIDDPDQIAAVPLPIDAAESILALGLDP